MNNANHISSFKTEEAVSLMRELGYLPEGEYSDIEYKLGLSLTVAGSLIARVNILENAFRTLQFAEEIGLKMNFKSGEKKEEGDDLSLKEEDTNKR